MRLQAQFQAQLNVMLQEDGAKLHLVLSAPPSFEVYGDRTVLHLTMRNTLLFERSTTSIYKRAAQSFDLFLAPELRGLLRKLPANAKYDALDFSVFNRLGTEKTPSETIDYICPLSSIRSFVEDKITSQDLIDPGHRSGEWRADRFEFAARRVGHPVLPSSMEPQPWLW